MNIKRAFNETGKKKIKKYVKMIVLIVGSPVLPCVLTMTGLFFDYESSKPLFSISINETEENNLNWEINIDNTSGKASNLKLSDAAIQLDLLVAVRGERESIENHIRIGLNDVIEKIGKGNDTTSFHITEKNMEYLPNFLNTVSDGLEADGYNVVSYAIKEYYSIEYNTLLGRKIHRIIIPDSNAIYYLYHSGKNIVRVNVDVGYKNIRSHLGTDIEAPLCWIDDNSSLVFQQLSGNNTSYSQLDSSNIAQSIVEGIEDNFKTDYVTKVYDETQGGTLIPISIGDKVEGFIQDNNGQTCGYKVSLKKKSGQ